MRKYVPHLGILMLSSIIFWQWLDKPAPEVVVVKTKDTLIDTKFLKDVARAMAEAEAIIDICYTTHNELRYNLSLCEADYLAIKEEAKEDKAELEAMTVSVEDCNTNYVPRLHEHKTRKRHAVTLLSGGAITEKKDTNGKWLSENVKPVVGLGYMYFITDDIGLGVMGYTNKTMGATITYRF